MSLPSSNPLGYVGIKETDVPQIYKVPRAPLATDYANYDLGDLWIDTVTNKMYALVKKLAGTASWVGAAGTGALETLTGNAGGAVGIDAAENINLTGLANSGITTNGIPGTNTLNISMVSPFAGDFVFSNATAATPRTLSVTNTDNTSVASNAFFQATSGGAAGGDPFINFLVTGAGTYSIGIDNSDSDKFKITTGASPSAGTDLFTMTTAGVITLANDLDVTEGGTGVGTFTAYSVICGGTTATGDLQNVVGVGTSGQVLTSNGAAALPTWQDNTSMAYVEATGATQAMAVQTAYGANRGAGVAFSLPATAAAGTVMKITGILGLWSLTQAAGQQVHVGAFSTTAGAGGSLTATNLGDCITLRCIVANTTFRVEDMMGNPAIV